MSRTLAVLSAEERDAINALVQPLQGWSDHQVTVRQVAVDPDLGGLLTWPTIHLRIRHAGRTYVGSGTVASAIRECRSAMRKHTGIRKAA